ncbi:MAG: TatD family deoxyribonuclease [Erysipelotrichia bacterium]|nr:TatD family deoxyribonuclease [Erysipelotrichia bacterium]
MTGYIDSHAHLFSEEFQDDFDAVIQRAKNSDVNRIMIMCTRMDEARRAMAFAAEDPKRYQVAVGIFPDDVDHAEEWYPEFEELIQNPGIAAVGEIGLDYHWVQDKKKEQQELFARQIESAKKVHKPILVHARDAMQDCFDIMKQHQAKGLMHCYSGSAEMAAEFTKMHIYISLGGVITFKNARRAREVCAAIDSSFLLSETDCPYMAPEPFRGTKNEPCRIPLIVAKMAEIRGIPEEDMKQMIYENYDRFLKEPA